MSLFLKRKVLGPSEAICTCSVDGCCQIALWGVTTGFVLDQWSVACACSCITSAGVLKLAGRCKVKSGRCKAAPCFVLICISFTVSEVGQVFLDVELFMFSLESSPIPLANFKLGVSVPILVDL